MTCDSRSSGFLLDRDCSLDWMEVLKLMEIDVSEGNWRKVVEWYNKHVATSMYWNNIPLLSSVDKDSQKVRTISSVGFERMSLKEKTGTLYFMAIQILDKCVAHDVQHDLESFFWLLLWIVLCHTKHTGRPRNKILMSVFNGRDEQDSVCRKVDFLRKRLPFEVVDNAPLTTLLSEFGRLCYDNVPQRGRVINKRTTLAYDDVLAQFDKVLAPDQLWPSDDGALDFAVRHGSMIMWKYVFDRISLKCI